MANVNFLPTREANLVTWLNTFQSVLTPIATAVGITSPQLTLLGTRITAFIAAYELCNADATNSRSATITKNQAKADVVSYARMLAGVIQKHPGTTNTQRSDLGLTVPAQRQPIGPTAYVPVMKLGRANGRTIPVTLLDPLDNKRKKPGGVVAISVYSYVGEQPPEDINAWVFEGNTTRTKIEVVFGGAVAPFAKVWLTALYLNPRQMAGAACTPISANLGSWVVQNVEGGGSQNDAGLKVAA